MHRILSQTFIKNVPGTQIKYLIQDYKNFQKKFARKEKGCIFAVPIEKGMWQMPRKLFEKAVSEKKTSKKINKNLEVQK